MTKESVCSYLNDISQEDEDVKRATAESLGQVYVPPQQHHEDWDEPFAPQHPVTYDQAVDMLFNINYCFGLYDKKIKQWRTAVYMKKWDHKKRLMVTFKSETRIKSGSDNYLTIKDFPVNYIILDDNKRFTVSELDLRDLSNLPKENIDKCVKEKTERQYRESNPGKQQQCKILVAGFIKEQEKKQQIISISFPGLEIIIAHYCCLLIYGLPISINWKTIIIAQKRLPLFNGDWIKRTDFTGVKLIGYLCDDGEVIKGDVLRQRTDKIFVYFNTGVEHYGNNYDWISIPNERICPPPKNTPLRVRPPPNEFGLAQVSTI